MTISAGAKFRQAYENGPIMIPGVFNALVARIAQRTGFVAAYQSGAALSAGLAAVPDVGLISLTEFVEQGRYLAQAVDIPLISDADTGFGEALAVERTVQLFEQAGLAGIHLEDQQLPKRCGHLSGKTLVSTAEMVGKLKAAVAARRDPSFVLIARTDARAVDGFDAAVERAQAYLEAGADMIFPEALQTPEEFAQFAEAVPAPLMANMTEFGKSPLLTFEELSQIGYRAMLLPVTMFRVAMAAVEAGLKEVLETGTQQGILERMQTRADLYELLGYEGYDQRDRSYFGGEPGE